MAVGDKIGDVVLRGAKSRLHAYWRPTDGSRDVFLCAMDSSAYNDHPHLRKMLSDLALEIAVNRERKAGDSMTFRVSEPLVESRAQWL
jgi:hypothetical protein